MRYTQILIYGVLLAIALIASYLTWTHEPPGGKGDVVVIDLDEGGLQQVIFEEPDLRVAVSLRGEGDGYCWGETRKVKDKPRKPEPPKRPGEEDADEDSEGDDDDSADGVAEPEPPERITEEKAFRGNETCDKVLSRFTPMKALREFESVTDDKAAEMELLDSEASLTEISDKGQRVFTVGGRVYGSNHYYLRENDTGRVLLVESRMIGDIKGGSTRLMESKLQPFNKDEVVRAVVASPQKQLEFLQQNRDDKKAAFWAASDEPASTADPADGWLDRVLRMRALQYIAGQPTNLQPAIRVAWFDDTTELGWMEFGTAVDADGETIYVARTGNTMEWVKVSDRMGGDTYEEIAELME